MIVPFAAWSIEAWAAIVTVVLAAVAVLQWGTGAVRWCLRRIERRVRAGLPRDTMRIVEISRSPSWNDGSVEGRPATQVNGTWLVSNVIANGDTDLVVANISLRLPLRLRRRIDRDLSSTERRVSQVIPAGTVADVTTIFWLVPGLATPGQDLAATVVFTDQFENRRRVKTRFRAPRPQPEPPERPRERLSEIADPIEKEIAAALQAELARYRTNGRREGGLGSVTTTYSGQRLRGAGGNAARTVGSPQNQVIIADPENASLESDNADSLIALYGSLDADAERQRFRTALLVRVDRDSAYAPVAYLPLLVALKLGFAPDFFAHARASLLGDHEYGYSNCLMLLNGLLRLRHPLFSDEMLDAIEGFADTDEHPFEIPERVAVIRTERRRAGAGSDRPSTPLQ